MKQLNKMLISKIGFSRYIVISLYQDDTGRVFTSIHGDDFYPCITAAVDAWLNIRPQLSSFDFAVIDLYELMDSSALVQALAE